MGCLLTKSKFHDNNNPNKNNRYNNQQIINKPIPVDSRLYQTGAKYLIKQVKQNQNAVNVAGGQIPIKLIFSLDKDCLNQNYRAELLYFEISFSDINNPKSFGPISLVNEINLMDLSYSNQIITNYFFEFDQKIKIKIYYNGKPIKEEYVSTAKLNGSLNHTEIVPISLQNNPNQPPEDFKLIIVSDPIEEELSRLVITFDMICNFNENFQFFAVFENTYSNKKQSIFKTEEAFGPQPRIRAVDIAFGDLSFDKSRDQEFDIVFYRRNRNIIERLGKVVYNLKELDNVSHNILNDNGAIIGSVSITPMRRTVKRFIDYIYSGMQIGMTAAIDFTASNGVVTNPTSLHYLYSPEPNQYEQAIRSAGGIISYYDTDKRFPCYGFGALYNGETSHCFNLTLTNQREVDGIDGIMEAYKNAIKTVSLNGPTFFSPIIKKTIEDVKSDDKGNNYYILLIITDGQISDERETREAIIEASILPLSIIIVGVGTADFSSMDRLDGDEYPLLDRNGKRARDIVQFVPYNVKYAMNPTLFSQDLLTEVPGQVEGYFRSIGK
jgi:hypothetical protein